MNISRNIILSKTLNSAHLWRLSKFCARYRSYQVNKNIPVRQGQTRYYELGLVTKTIEGAHGATRSTKILSKEVVYRRSVIKLALLLKRRCFHQEEQGHRFWELNLRRREKCVCIKKLEEEKSIVYVV